MFLQPLLLGTGVFHIRAHILEFALQLVPRPLSPALVTKEILAKGAAPLSS